MIKNIQKKNGLLFPLLIAAMLTLLVSADQVYAAQDENRIGVLYVVHGGMKYLKSGQYVWDSVVHQFTYNHNHALYNFIIWNPFYWPMLLDRETTDWGRRFLLMFEFGYARMGGVDPFPDLVNKQVSDLQSILDNNTLGLEFDVDWAGYMAPEEPDHYAYPRYLYHVPNLFTGVPPLIGLSGVTYCGESEPDGPWEGCDPQRYDVDGPVERLLEKGASQIIVIDLTVSGPRFSKTFDVIQMTKKALDNWNKNHGTSVSLYWVNDPANLMERSYPTRPFGWTLNKKEPYVDPSVPLDESPNPIAEDPLLAQFFIEGIENRFSDTVSDDQTAVLLFNHALHDYNEYFDPKIDDTLILNKNIKSMLIERHPDLDPDNIIGCYGGIKALNPENGLVERTREMRGESYGYAWLYESDKQMPGDEWGYRYWDACEYVIGRGVKHIVVAFPQLIASNHLGLIEVPNQFAKEIGRKTWARFAEGDYNEYPDHGNPFADYWGIWADTQCGDEPCCFEMGGCSDGRQYPPPRQEPLNSKREDLDPSVVFDVSDYGHLGYDPALGPPDPNGPVQDQYTGTWDMYQAPHDDPRIVQFLADHVLDAVSEILY